MRIDAATVASMKTVAMCEYASSSKMRMVKRPSNIVLEKFLDEQNQTVEIDALSPGSSSPLRRKKISIVMKEDTSMNSLLPVMLAIRFLDNLSMNTVLPTLPTYTSSIGGTSQLYYNCIAGFAAGQFCAAPLIGAYVDSGKGRIRTAMIATMSIGILANLMYVLPSAVPSMRSAIWLVMARTLSGAVAANQTLTMVLLGELNDNQVRQVWTVRMGMTRSQGLFWGPPLGFALSFLSGGHDLGVFGACAMPGWFQAVALGIAMIVLLSVWQPIQEKELPNGDNNIPLGKKPTLAGFFIKPQIFTVAFMLLGTNIIVNSVETLVPLVMHVALGWKGASSGMPLTMMAVLLTCGQLVVLTLTKSGCQDRTIALGGAVAVPSILLSACAFWLSNGSKPFSTWEVVVPFWVLATSYPSIMLSSFGMMARLAREYAPECQGGVQGVVQNLMGLGGMLAPTLLSFTYASTQQEAERVPRTTFLASAALTIASLLGLAINYMALKPRPTGTPLLQS